MLRPETLEKYKEVDRIRAEGQSIENACLTMKAGMSAYLKWKKDGNETKSKKKYQRQKNKTFMQEIPVAQAAPQKLICVIGSPHELSQFIRSHT